MARFREKLGQSDTTVLHRASLAYNIFRLDLHQLLARYTAGESPEAMRAQFPRVVDELAASVKAEKSEGVRLAMLDDYTQSLWMVSLAILLDADASSWNELVSLYNDAGKDELFERLVGLRSPHRTAPLAPTLHPNPYARLLVALDAVDEDRPRLIKDYLDSWYKALKEAYWHGQHKIEGVGFFGYWSLETAAFVRMLRIPHAAFSDHPNYPRDLVRD